MSDTLWAQVRECFDSDDGSLPGIEVTKLSREGVAAIYAMLRSRSQLLGDSSEFWNCESQSSCPVDCVPNAPELVASGQAEAFHVLITGLCSAGVEMPALGVFVFPDTIALDYRMGSEWGPTQVVGFFELLRDCCALDPNAVVVPAMAEGPPYPDRFTCAWSLYLGTVPRASTDK